MEKSKQQVFIFVDFNSTLVDFENEYDSIICVSDLERFESTTRNVKTELTKCLKIFEQKTGMEPVICVITNASYYNVDNNGAPGIHQDMHMTFFNHGRQDPAFATDLYENNCEKYFKYLVYKENDFYFEINPLGQSIDEMFVPRAFDERALKINYCKNFKKRESVERLMTVLDPDSTKGKFCIFAGDSIKDDYPMKMVNTCEGMCKIFIRPGKTRVIKPSLMYEFCLAKGLEFKSIHPRTGKRIKCFDEQTIQYLLPEERAYIDGYDDGDHVLLTSKNSRGLIEGLYQSIDIINLAKQTNQYQKQ